MIIAAKTPMTIPAMAPPERLEPAVLEATAKSVDEAVAVAGMRKGSVLVAPLVVTTVYVVMLVGRIAAETVAVTIPPSPPVVAPLFMQAPELQNWPAPQHVLPQVTWPSCALHTWAEGVESAMTVTVTVAPDAAVAAATGAVAHPAWSLLSV